MRKTLLILWLLSSAWLVVPAIPAGEPDQVFAPVQAKVGGKLSPDGDEIQIDLPGNLHRKNTSSAGLGLCVFTSIHHAAIWQSVPQLQEFPKWIIENKIPGGGHPQKVTDLITKISKARHMPEPEYVQVQGADTSVLKLALASGRMPCVTYNHSPTGRYSGQNILHMVNISHGTDKWFAVLDNNYIGETNYEWMSPTEFNGTYAPGGRGGWSVILLNPGPPPIPRN
jgi:hypothetical protein